MISILDDAIVAHPTVEPTLFVDDVAGEKDGEADDIAEELGVLHLEGRAAHSGR